MATSQAKKHAQKRLSLERIGQEIRSGSSLAAAILAAAVVDDVLRIALVYNLIKLSSEDEKSIFGGNGPLATFSARIRLAHAMGLISRKLRADLDKLRTIRNEYAHKAVEMSLQDEPQRRAICELFAVSDIPDMAHMPSQELLGRAVDKIGLFLIMRTSPPKLKPDSELLAYLKCLDYSDFLETKRRANQ